MLSLLPEDFDLTQYDLGANREFTVDSIFRAGQKLFEVLLGAGLRGDVPCLPFHEVVAETGEGVVHHPFA